MSSALGNSSIIVAAAGVKISAPDIKGIPAPGMLIGFSLAWTLSYAVATRGTDHLTGMPPAAFYRANRFYNPEN